MCHSDEWNICLWFYERLDAILLELPFALPALQWHLYWHRSADRDQANTWLRNKLLQFMRAAQQT